VVSVNVQIVLGQEWIVGDTGLMLRVFLCWLCLVSSLACFAEPRVLHVQWLANGLLELEVRVDDLSEDPVFAVVWSQDLAAPLASWEQSDIQRQQLSDDGLWLVQVEAFGSGQAFYRIIQTDGLTTSSPIVLSEICSSNAAILMDEDGDYSDWIELWNGGDSIVSLKGWSLSDRVDPQDAWLFPDVTLEPKEYLLIFASGKDRRLVIDSLHTSFRINADGEPVVLRDAEGRLVDAVRLGALEQDASLGRSGMDGSQWSVFDGDAVTPGTLNRDAGVLFVEQPEPSLQPGFYDRSMTLNFGTLMAGLTVYYSVNGDDPLGNGVEFEIPLKLEQTSVVRAVAVNAHGDRSEEVTGTYFIGDRPTLAVVSLAAPASHFEIRDGYLYGFGEHMFGRRGTVTANFPYSASNAWKDREVPISFELFEPDGTRGFQQELGIKVFGGWGSRGYPQKSLAFFARAEYGKGKVRYPLFPDSDIDAFESFVLRNSGNDNQSTHHIPPRSEITAFGRTRPNGSYFVNGNYTLMRDAMMHRLAANLQVDRQAYRPVIVYLNGEYWGIYNLREKLNEHYVASHYDLEANEIDLIEGYGTANSGSSSQYSAMRNYMESGSLASEDRYARVVDNYLDVQSFTDYHLAVIYFQNFDIGNIKQWRARRGGKFRWMLYDQDYGFNLWKPEVYLPAMRRDFADYDNMFDFHTNASGNGTGWPNAGGRTMMLRKMLENDGFRTQFINRCADLLNTDFESERVVGVIEEMAAVIRPEIPRHLARWSWGALLERNHGSPFDEEDEPLSIEQWESHVQGLKEFARERPEKLRHDLMSHFGMTSGIYRLQVQVEPPEAGVVHINSTTHHELPLSEGIYFSDVPIGCVAEASDGYRFKEWAPSGQTTELIQLHHPEVALVQLKAIFTPQ
jgi:hypothetical protein